MYENTAITIDYVVYKIGVLTKSIEELEQLEKYIIDEEKVYIFTQTLYVSLFLCDLHHHITK